MTFARAIRTCLGGYARFSGRASRSEYWYFVLFIFLGGLVTAAIDGILFGRAAVHAAPDGFRAESGGPISAIFSLATLLPLISAGWRRMHDSGRTGLHLFYPLIVVVGIMTFVSIAGIESPLNGAGLLPEAPGLVTVVLGLAMVVLAISPLIVIWWLTRPTEPGANRYGPPPEMGAST